jgi:hypothetical protein
MKGKNGYYLGFKEEKTSEMVTISSKTKKKVDKLVESAEKLVILFAAENFEVFGSNPDDVKELERRINNLLN